MIAVDHCEANSHGFRLGAFDNWEELAVAAGAPDDFLGAHCSLLVDVEMMVFFLWVNDWLPVASHGNE